MKINMYKSLEACVKNIYKFLAAAIVAVSAMIVTATLNSTASAYPCKKENGPVWGCQPPAE